MSEQDEISEEVEVKDTVKKTLTVVFLSFGILVAMLVIGALPFYNVDAGEKGVKYSRSDGVQEENFGEGLHFKIPVWETARTYDVRNQTIRDETSSPTNERQEVMVTYLVTYHINRSEVWQFHKFVGEDTAMKKLKDSIETELKAATVQRTIHENLLDRQQNVMEEEIESNLSTEMAEFKVTVTDVDIPNIQPDGDWIEANEKKVIAKEKAIEEKHREKAELARHNQTIIKAEADAKSIELVREELPEGAGYNEYLAIKKWDGKMPDVVASGGQGGSIMDILVPQPTNGTALNRTVTQP